MTVESVTQLLQSPRHRDSVEPAWVATAMTVVLIPAAFAAEVSERTDTQPSTPVDEAAALCVCISIQHSSRILVSSTMSVSLKRLTSLVGVTVDRLYAVR